MERAVEEALREAGDATGALAWRRLVADLGARLRVVVLAADGRLAARVAERIEAEAAVLPADSPEMAIEEALLGSHLLLWATPVTAPLGAREREAVASLGGAVPERRAIVLADLHLLERLSDDPEREAGEVAARVEALLPDGWEILEEGALAERARALREDLPALAAARRAEVARHLLSEASAAADAAVRREEVALDAIADSEAAEAARIARERRHLLRSAAHLLAAVRRRTEELLVELRDFLVALEQDLRPQVEAVDDLDLARRALPHWLQATVATRVDDALVRWREAVRTDLEEAGVTEEEAARAELLVPALYPGPIPAETDWTERLAVTAALGGGAALLAVGLALPGALVAASGLAWSALGRDARRASTRERLVEAGRAAIRRLGEDADRLLRDQIAALEAEVAGDQEARAPATEAERAHLDAQRAEATRRLERATAVRDRLRERREAIFPEASG